MKLDVMRPAIQAACDNFENGAPDDDDERDDGDLLNARIRAALRGSDWRYVANLGGTLKREVEL